MRTRRWLIPLLMLVFAALACDPPPVTGINCIYEGADGVLIAPEDTNTYVSSDGGITWAETGHSLEQWRTYSASNDIYGYWGSH